MKPAFLLIFIALLTGLSPQQIQAAPHSTPVLQSNDLLGVQEFLDQQPGPLKHYRDNELSAAVIIENNSLYYGISPRLHLALLETVNGLLSTTNPPNEALSKPYNSTGPHGFAAQIEWASRELRAGLGPYKRPPTLRFTDGTTTTLTLEQAPEGVAVQRFLAIGRTSDEWHALVHRFGQVFQDTFDNELPDLTPPPSPFTGAGFLYLPWPASTRVVHLAYFDHVYPTVDSGPDNTNFVVTYLGQGNAQYNTHDGHDYYFPDQPIGTPILAAAPGVAYARTHRGNGVVIRHDNGYETVYWHLDGFADIFQDRVDDNTGVRVEAGDMIGTSGATGFVIGTPHLHFEVRHHGRQVDPYGWYGPGPDPCAAYAGCAASTWLWHSSLRGLYDFTPPDLDPRIAALQTRDTTPPLGTLSINPPEDLLFLAGFDGHTLQSVGHGFPIAEGDLTFEPGRYGDSLRIASRGGLTYPISDNVHLEAGSISLWARVPERYPPNSIQRHYLFAASANTAGGSHRYPGTIALRRDLLGPDNTPQWTFWTTPLRGEDEPDYLSVADTLAPGWHHFAVTWDAEDGSKTLYLDGEKVASVTGIVLPENVGSVLQIGRFTYGGSQSGMLIDDLAVFGRALSAHEIAELADASTPVTSSATALATPTVQIDTNATDREGGVVAVQLGRNGVFEDPQPYYDAFRWSLPQREGAHSLAVRYFDRAGNSTTITRTVEVDLPPRGNVTLIDSDELQATLEISATDVHNPIAMQISSRPDFGDAGWQPLRQSITWEWEAETRLTSPAGSHPATGRSVRHQERADVPRVHVWFRDANGNITRPLRITAPAPTSIYFPLICAR